MMSKLPDNQDWTELVKSGNRIYLGANAAVPRKLMTQLMTQKPDLVDVEICQFLTLGDAPWAAPQCSQQFKVNTFFISGDDIRVAVDEGRADYTPCFLSEIHTLFANDTLPLDVALIMVSPPDELGYCSLGVSVDITLSAALAAKHIVAQVNQHMPRTNGQSFLHVNQFSALIYEDAELPIIEAPQTDPIYQALTPIEVPEFGDMQLH